MPVTMGSMDYKEKEKIRKNRTYLKENLDVTAIMDYCVNVELLTIGEVIELDMYLDDHTRKEQNDKFLELLSKSGDDAYNKFVKLLKQHGGKHLAEKLENTEVPPVQASEDKPSSNFEDNLTDVQKETRLTTKDIVSFAAAVPLKEVRNFGQILELSKADIDSLFLDYHHYGNKTIRLQLMNKWLTRNGKAAIVGALLEAFKEFEEIGHEIYHEEVKCALQKKFGKK